MHGKCRVSVFYLISTQAIACIPNKKRGELSITSSRRTAVPDLLGLPDPLGGSV
jgi:hypothetical protein